MYKSPMLNLRCTIALKLPNNFCFNFATTVWFRMSKCTLGPIRLIDVHTKNMGGLGKSEDLLLISLILQCITYGVYDNVDFRKEKCHDSECFNFNISVLIYSLDGYKTRNSNVPVSASYPPPLTQHPATSVDISEYADLHYSFLMGENLCQT